MDRLIADDPVVTPHFNADVRDHEDFGPPLPGGRYLSGVDEYPRHERDLASGEVPAKKRASNADDLGLNSDDVLLLPDVVVINERVPRSVLVEVPEEPKVLGDLKGLVSRVSGPDGQLRK